MNWEKLKVFRKVAKAGSFLNASKQDNKSQSTFSRAVMDLEKDINKKLDEYLPLWELFDFMNCLS